MSEEVKTEGTQLVPVQQQGSFSLQAYGRLDELKEMTRRVILLDKGRHKVNVAEAIMVAQEALATDANVTNGELWWWVDVRNGERLLTIHWGQKYWVRIGDEWADAHDTKFKYNHRLIEGEELLKLNFKETDLVIETQLRDMQLVDKYIEQITNLAKVEMPLDKIERIVGEEPVLYGYGVVSKEEREGKFRSSEAVYPHLQRATKRSTMNAVKQVVSHKKQISDQPANLEGFVKTDWIPKLGDTVVDAVFSEQVEVQVPNEVPEGFEDVLESVKDEQLRYALERLKYNKDEDILSARQKATYWDEGLLTELMGRVKGLKSIQSVAGRLAYSHFKKEVEAGGDEAEQAVAWLEAFDRIKKSGTPHDNHSAGEEATRSLFE